jgi:hypothetical protein
MVDQLSAGPAGSATGFGYFVLKMRLPPHGETPMCAGVVERLGTAERRSFENADELIRLLSRWSGDAGKMQGGLVEEQGP